MQKGFNAEKIESCKGTENFFKTKKLFLGALQLCFSASLRYGFEVIFLRSIHMESLLSDA